MFVQATLFVQLFTIAAAQQRGGVTFWRETFTMTCPIDDGIGCLWDKDGESSDDRICENTLYYNFTTKGLHHCGNKAKKYYFYVDGKVCKDCFELDGNLFGGIIIADVALTGLVMWIIFRCASKRSSAGPSPPKAPARAAGGPAPPTRAGEYETLSAHTLSQDPYSALNRTS